MAGFRSSRHEIILLLIFIASVPVLSAPYLNEAREDSQKQIPLDHFFRPSQGLIGPLFRQNDISLNPPSQGVCHYQLRYYEEGERIDTQEPCLNCTCHNAMLMCYLKVCPFSKPIGKDCTVEKSPDQCCPVITCPQVPVNLQLMHMPPSTTTASPASTTAVAHFTEHGCSIENQYYPDGAQVPGDPRKPCELCYCIRNHTACIMQECILKVDGCDPVFEDGICCPIRYMCAHDKQQLEHITTTTTAPNGTVIMTTTTLQPPLSDGCLHDGEFYADGALIDSSDPCEHCYCMNSDVVCAIQECRSPLDEEDENCIPRAPPPGQCCPEAYDCPDFTETTTLKQEITESPSKIEITPETVTDKEEDIHIPSTDPVTEEATVEETTLAEEIKLTTVSVPKITEDSLPGVTDPSMETEKADLDDLVDTTLEPQIEDLIITTTIKSTDEDVVSETSQPEVEISTEPVSTSSVITESPSKVDVTDKIETKPEEVEQPFTVPTDTEVSETFEFKPEDELVDVPETQEGPVSVEPEFETSKPSIKPEEATDSALIQELTTQETKIIDETDEPKITEDMTSISPETVDITEEPEKMDISSTVPPKEILSDKEPPKETLTEEVDIVTKYPEEKTTTPDDHEENEITTIPTSILETKLPEDLSILTEKPEDHIVTEKPDEPADDLTTLKPSVDYDEISIPFIDTMITEQPIISPVTTEHLEKVTEEKIPSTTVDQGEEMDIITTVQPEVTEEIQTDAPDKPLETQTLPESAPSHELSLTPEKETVVEVEPEVVTDVTSPAPVKVTTTSTPLLITASGVCNANGTIYQDGESVPILNQCQEECQCKSSVITCQFRACPSPPPVFLRCDIRQEQEDCCPQYECPVFEAAEEPSPNCVRDGIQYNEGDYVPSKDLCTDCYCLYGDIVCAFQECPEYDKGCKALEMPKGSCCPTKYECPEMEVGDMTMDKEEKSTDPSVEVTTTPMTEEGVDVEVTDITTSVNDEQTTPSVVQPEEELQTEQPTISSEDKEQTTIESFVTVSPGPEEISATETVKETTSEAIITTLQPEEVSEGDASTSQPEKEDATIQPSVSTEEVAVSVTEEDLVTHPESVTEDFVVESTTHLEEETSVPEMVTEDISTVTDSVIVPHIATESEKDMEAITIIPEIVTEKESTPKDVTAPVVTEIDMVTEALTLQPEIATETVDTSTTLPEETTDEIEILEVSTSEPEKVTDEIEILEVSTSEPEKVTDEIEIFEVSTSEPEKVTDEIEILEVSTSEPEKVTEHSPTEEVVTTQLTIDEEKEIVPEVSTEQPEVETLKPDVEISTPEPETVTEHVDTEDAVSTVQPDVEVDESISTIKPEIVTDKVSVDEHTTIQPDSEDLELVTEISEAEITTHLEPEVEVTDPSVDYTTHLEPEVEVTDPSVDYTTHLEPEVEVTDPSVEYTTLKPQKTTDKDTEILTERPESIIEEVTEFDVATSAEPESITEDVEIAVDTTPSQQEEITEEILTQKPIVEAEVEISTKYPDPEIEETTPVLEKEIEDDFPEEHVPTTSKYIEDTFTKRPEEHLEIFTELQETKTSAMPETADTTITYELETSKETVSDTERPISFTLEPEVSTSHMPEIATEKEITVTTSKPEVGIPGEGLCLINGTEYQNGVNVPTSSQCQEECTCKDSVVTCQLRACPAPPPMFLRCEVTQQTDECCPSYECPVVESSSEPSPKCRRDNVQYFEGDYVPSEDICTDCYCLYGEIVCATLECPSMPHGCIRSEFDTGACCPTKYECPEHELGETTTSISPLEAITEKETDQEFTTEEIIGKEPSLQTERPAEEQTVKSTTLDDSSPFVTGVTAPQTDKGEMTTSTSHIDEISTQVYIDELMLITTDKSPSEDIQEMDTTKIQTEKPLITTYPEVSLEQDSSTILTTESLSEMSEEQTEPSKIVHTTVATDIEVETKVPTEELFPVTSSVTEKESTEVMTESMLDVETGKYTSKPDFSTSTYEETDDLVTDRATTKKTVEETTTTFIEKDVFTELPTTMTPDEETTEKPVDIPENKTLFESKPVTKLPEVEEEISKEEPYAKCVWANATFEHGLSVPPASECQDFCKCDNGTVKCKHRACPPVPPSFLRCATSSSNDTCCPSYDCGEPEPSDHFCLHEGMIFNNGDYVPSGTECLDCYCLEGEVVCASLECGVPRADCNALVQRNSDCCPILYECSESPVEAGEFMISPEEVTEIIMDASTPIAPTTKLISQDLSVDITSEPSIDDSTSYFADLTTIKAAPTEDLLVTKPVHPISVTSVQPADALEETSYISRETTLSPLEKPTEAPEEASDISRETTLRPIEQPTEVPEETFEISIETTLKPEQPTEAPEETSDISRETTLEPIGQPTEAPEEISDIAKESTLRPIEQPTEVPEETSDISRETTLRPIEQPTEAPEEISDISIETTLRPIGKLTESPEEITDIPRETTLEPISQPTEAPEEITDIAKEATLRPIEQPTEAPEETSDIYRETTTGSIPTESPKESFDISRETTLKPKEILEDKITSIPDVTTSSEMMVQPTTKEVQEQPTDSSSKDILTTEATIDGKPISTDTISVTESISPVSKPIQESLTETPVDDDIPTEKLTVKPEEIISFEKEKEEVITSTTMPVTTLATSKVISEEQTSSSKEPLTTVSISTTSSKEIVEEPSIPATIPEEPKVEKPEDHKIESESELPFPPFPGDLVLEPHIGVSQDFPVKEKDPTSGILFSPSPETHDTFGEFPEEKPIDETVPEIFLPPGIFAGTHIPPQILNQTTTWKPTTTTELVLGPGYCLFDRKVYASAEQIPRDDPCDFCFCFRGDIICLQQTCPDAIDGCYEEAIEGFCCPRYECPVRQEIVNITTTTPSPIPGFPPIQKTSRVAMCEIEGKHYASGEVVKSASSPCHECICGTDGFMKCIPKECDTKRKIYKHGYR